MRGHFSSERRSAARSGLWGNNQYRVESLEPRRLLAASLLNVPTWVEQGPGPITNGQTNGLPDNPVSGAVNAIAINPANPAQVFIATVNGGIWRTNNINASPVSWTPLTDQMPSLAISSIAISPFDTSGQTLYAGTGNFSSAGRGGDAAGIYKSTDGGDTWFAIGGPTPSGHFATIGKVVPVVRTLAGGTKQEVLLVGSSAGISRSLAGGPFVSVLPQQTFPDPTDSTRLLVAANTDLVADPGNPGTFYAAFARVGLFRSTDFGANWQPINAGMTKLSTSTNFRFAVHFNASAGTRALYVGQEVVVGKTGSHLAGVFRSTDQGTTWTKLANTPDVDPGGQGDLHFSIVADPVDDTIVYIGGDSQESVPHVGTLAEGFTTLNTWVSISDSTFGSGANGTGPHADSRFMVFLGADILEADDGGVYRLRNANSGQRKWEPLIGNLRATEFFTVAYEPVLNGILGAAQDNGSPFQTAAITAPASSRFKWNEMLGLIGDGATADVDVVHRDGFGNLDPVRYASNQIFSGLQRVDADFGIPAFASMNVMGTSGKHLNDSSDDMATFDTTLGHNNAFALNSVVSGRVLIGSNFLYESFNSADDFKTLGGAPLSAAANVTHVTALAYGGMSGGAAQPDVAVVGTAGVDTDGDTIPDSNFLRVRLTGTGLPAVDSKYPGSSPRDIALEPLECHSAWVLDDNNRVWLGNGVGQSGESWSDVTGNLSDPNLRTIVLVGNNQVPVAVVGGRNGVYRMDPNENSIVWQEFGRGLPNALVTDLHWDATDDVLLAGTFGRGAWTISNVSSAIHADPILKVDGTASDDALALQLDTQNPSNLIVVLNGDLTRFPLAPIKRVEFNAMGGGDTLGVNNTGGPVTFPGGIVFNGGAGTDSFLVAGGTVKATQDLYFATVGSSQTTSQITYDDGSKLTTTFNDVEKVADDINSDQLIVTATNAKNNMILDDGAGTGDGRLRVQITDVNDTTVYPPIEFSQKAQVVLNADASVVLFGADDNISLSNTEPAFGMTELIVNGLLGDDKFLVSNVSVPTTVRGGDGQDTITVGKPTFLINPITGVPILTGDTLTSIDAAVTVLGDGGVFADKDTLDIVATSPTGGALSGEVNNHAVTGFGTQSSGISYSGIDALSLSLNALDDSVFVRSTVAGIPTTIDAGGGADLIRFGSQGGFNMPAFGTVVAVDGAVTVSGGGGDDTLVFDDSGDTSNASATVTTNQITGLGTAGVTYNGIDAISIFLGLGSDSATIKSLAQGVDCTVSGMAGNDEVDFDFHTLGFGSSLTVNGGPNGAAGDTLKLVNAFKSDVLTVTQDQVTLAGNTAVVHFTNVENIDTDAATAITNGMFMANSFHTGGGAIVFSTSQHLTGLTIAGGLVALSGTGNTIFTPTLSITNGGRLELGGATLELDYGAAADPAAQIRSLLSTGTGGTAGITSSTATGKFALGFTDSADSGAPGTLVVRQALIGDANLDGKVDFTDLLALAQNFGQKGRNWDQGDLDYDGQVGFADLLKLAQHYGNALIRPARHRSRSGGG